VSEPNRDLLALLDRGWPPEDLTPEQAREWIDEFNQEVLMLELERKEAEDA
jgi:hypothetical protein